MVENGFTRGIGFPSVFRHETWNKWTLVHGDDYFSAGSPEGFKWLEDTLTKRCDIKTSRIGHGPACSSEGQILNRVVRATDRGFEMEAGPRLAELIIEQLGLLIF